MKTNSFVLFPLITGVLGLAAMPASARDRVDENGPDSRRDDRAVVHSVPGHYYGGSYNHGGGYYGGHYYAYRPRWNFGFGVYSWPWWGPHYYDYNNGTVPRDMQYAHPIYLEPAIAVAQSMEVDVQRALAHRGYYNGPVDGELGPVSREAIRTYQARHALSPTGRVNAALLRSLKLL